MFGDVARRRPIKPRIIHDFDLSAKGAESGPLVKRQRGRMIESAGVHPQPADRPGPRRLKAAINQQMARPAAYQLRGYAEEGELALAWGSEIQLKQTFVAAVLHQCIYVHQRRLDDA